MTLKITTIKTNPFEGQKPGTSGLRKRVKVFQQENYTENFVQAILSAIPTGAVGAHLVVGGDGRYFCKEAVQIIVKLAAGNGVSKLTVGRDAILSTPAASNVIRKRAATGGILLTASHNPGGPKYDFGIKYNVANGGPAPESVTDKIYDITKTLAEYKKAELPDVDLSTIGVQRLDDNFEVEIIDSVTDYVKLMETIFDFEKLRSFFSSHPDFTVLFDGMHGVTGPYGHAIFVGSLGLPETSVMNAVPLTDFGGGHPDPNLTYAHELVERVNKEGISFGAASDGDGDRNMIIGNGVFVTPSDSVAVIAHWAEIAIPYFKQHGVKGLARSMPTSQALDLVAQKKGLEYFEVPTGWKFFGNLMDAGRCNICGEESFGTGSDHIREKDGIWAILAWLSILASAPVPTVHAVLQSHYAIYGRNFFSRYDYEEVDGEGAGKLVNRLRGFIASGELKDKEFGGFKVKEADDFEYHDPIDRSVSSKQGVRLIFSDGSRIIFRLSGTGSQGATVRLYVEKYSADNKEFAANTQEGLRPLINVALEVSNLKEFTGRDEPTVIT